MATRTPKRRISIVWPQKAKAYVMSVEAYGVKTYFEHAF